MSFFGWNELQPGNVWFTGTAVRTSYASGATGDDDWSLMVYSDDPKWMVNSHGARNSDPWIECEVQPPQTFAGLNAKDPATMHRFFDPFVSKHVAVGGTWCEDLSHDNKTELHSVDWVYYDPPLTSGMAKRSQFIVTSDGATRDLVVRPALPPHVRSNRIRDWFIPFPPAPPGVSDDDWYRWTFVEEVDAARSKYFQVLNDNGKRSLHCRIESGISDENKGFYAATVELGQPALFVGQSVPTQVPAGGRATATITMRNTSTETWQNFPTLPLSQFPYSLGSQDPQDNNTWGMGRVPIPGVTLPGASVTFTFTFTAPTTPGTYPFQWRMVREQLRWFGMSTPVVQIQVTPIQVDCAGLSRQLADVQAKVTPLLDELADLPAGRDGAAARAAILRQLTPLQAQAKGLRVQMSEGGCPT
jgi:Ig-like domain from next to BRCA1 gene